MRTEVSMPRARVKQLIVQEVEDETLVYDLDRHKAHCLNKTAAAIWRLCDGQTSIRQTARAVHDEFGLPDDDTVVVMALGQLDKARLLGGPVRPQFASSGRREALKRIGLVGGGAALLPIISSIVAPTPAAAATCIVSGLACTASAQCCSGLCNAMVCA